LDVILLVHDQSSEPGCPWRWTAGADRPCAEHDADDRLLEQARADLGLGDLGELSALTQVAPGEPGPGDHTAAVMAPFPGISVTDRTDPRATGPSVMGLPAVPAASSQHTGPPR
jgi:hypothetical protein